MSNGIANFTEEEKNVIRASIGEKYRLSKHIGWRETAIPLLKEVCLNKNLNTPYGLDGNEIFENILQMEFPETNQKIRDYLPIDFRPSWIFNPEDYTLWQWDEGTEKYIKR